MAIPLGLSLSKPCLRVLRQPPRQKLPFLDVAVLENRTMLESYELNRLLARARGDDRILAVISFGSTVRGENTERSDVDVCLVPWIGPPDRRSLSELRIEYVGEFDLDVQVFPLLPLFVRSRVLREGSVLFNRDDDALYEVAARTVRAFEAFKPTYRAYLSEVLRAGS